MCGIAGVLSKAEDPGLYELAARMNASLRHRGPDGANVFACPSGRAALAHQRLAIIDLATGAQPMSDRAGERTIVFNGEIYNFQALRREQEARGYTFATHSDTEVLLAGLVLDGERSIGRLRGMFAFAVWDASARALLLARDRFGKKPLFHAEHDGRLYFASEIKALLRVLPAPEVDRVALLEYLALGYVPGERTIYRGIRRLPPAHTLRIDERGRTLRRYWELPPPDDRETACSPAAWESRIAPLLDEAVRLRMIAEVPLGAFLSGGLDSSTIVALCLKHVARPFHTFSIRVADAHSADADAAREVAALLGTTHHEEVLDCPTPDELEALFHHFDEPFADSSMIPTAAVSRAARRVVTVALSGDGGDEIFGGYGVYAIYRDLSRLARLPMVSALARQATRFWPRGRVGAEGLARLAAPSGERYLRILTHFSVESLARLVGGAPHELAEARAELEELFRPPPGAGAVAEAQWIDAARGYLPGDILPKVDLASMASSLEVRAPLLDHVLAEELARLPASLRMSGRRGKLLLRRIAARHLPTRIIERRKVGFSVPLGRWLDGPLAPLVASRVFDPHAALAQHLDVAAAQKVLAGEPAGRRPALLFTLLSLGAWAERDRPPRTP